MATRDITLRLYDGLSQARKIRAAIVFGLLFASVRGYYWDWVEEPPYDYPQTTIWHNSDNSGTQATCRVDNWASGVSRLHTENCLIPDDGDEHWVDPPFEVLVQDELAEMVEWSYTQNPEEIRRYGMLVCEYCDSAPEMYACASPAYGPGKLVIWDDTDIVCYVGWDGDVHEMREGYQVPLAIPAVEYNIFDVTYYLDDLQILQDGPLVLAYATLINNDESEQVITHILSYAKTSTYEWGVVETFTFGITTSMTAGIPLLGEFGWEISTEQTYEYSYGESYSETIEISLVVQVTIPPKHSCDVSVVGRRMVVDVPYNAKVEAYFPDGSMEYDSVSGVYEGVTVSQDTAEIEDCIPIE